MLPGSGLRVFDWGSCHLLSLSAGARLSRPTNAGGAIAFDNFRIATGATCQGRAGHEMKVATTYLYII